jgi:hypothetical protein
MVHLPRTWTKVAVTTGLAERSPGIEHPWTVDQSVRDCRRQAPVCTPSIPDGSKTTSEHAFSNMARRSSAKPTL